MKFAMDGIFIQKDVHALLQQLNGHLQLRWLLQAYQWFPQKRKFFPSSKKINAAPQDYFFNKLAGNNMLMQQVQQGLPENKNTRKLAATNKCF